MDDSAATGQGHGSAPVQETVVPTKPSPSSDVDLHDGVLPLSAERLAGLPIITRSELQLHFDPRKKPTLGRGAYGRVMKGHWTGLPETEVAIKLLEDAAQRRRFEDDVRLLHRLRGAPQHSAHTGRVP